MTKGIEDGFLTPGSSLQRFNLNKAKIQEEAKALKDKERAKALKLKEKEKGVADKVDLPYGF